MLPSRSSSVNRHKRWRTGRDVPCCWSAFARKKAAKKGGRAMRRQRKCTNDSNEREISVPRDLAGTSERNDLIER